MELKQFFSLFFSMLTRFKVLRIVDVLQQGYFWSNSCILKSKKKQIKMSGCLFFSKNIAFLCSLQKRKIYIEGSMLMDPIGLIYKLPGIFFSFLSRKFIVVSTVKVICFQNNQKITELCQYFYLILVNRTGSISFLVMTNELAIFIF